MINWKGSGMTQSWSKFKVPSQHLPGEMEENYEKLKSGYPVSRLRFEPMASKI
jgi:hypothetical protein